MSQPITNKSIFWGSLIVLSILILPLIIWPAESFGILDGLKTGIEDLFGTSYQILAAAVMIFVAWIAFSKHGKIVFGANDYNFSLFSWASMLFCAGVATGILYWGIIEWAYYYDIPPFGITPKSELAAQYATMYGVFHWGGVGWAFYALPAVAIGYMYYIKNIPFLRLSVACQPILGKYADGPIGKAIDIFFMVGLLGSSGTSMGLGIPMITASLQSLWGIPDSFFVKVLVIVFCAIIFSISVYYGLGKGIKRLSNLNTSVAIIFLTFVFIVGPTVFITKMSLNNFGLMISEYVRMMTWTDPLTNSRFVEDWTIFYWAWWVAVGPFMGIFITKISGGRSIKQIILGTILFGSLGSAFFFNVLGNYALDLELTGVLSTTDIIQNGNPAAAIPAVISTLPFGSISLIIFCLMSVTFIATSFDSTSYTLAACATDHLKAKEEPARWHRLFWAFVLIALPTALMLVGGLESLKLTVLVSALPLVIVYVIMSAALYKNLSSHKS